MSSAQFEFEAVKRAQMSSRQPPGDLERDADAKFHWDWIAVALIVLAVVLILVFTFELWISHGE